jgi:hypothetical protein
MRSLIVVFIAVIECVNTNLNKDYFGYMISRNQTQELDLYSIIKIRSKRTYLS